MDRPYACPLEACLSKIGGRYKMVIVYHLLRYGTLRFSQLQKRVPSATAKMLTQHLRQLEEDGIVHREVYPVIPPKTEYSLTDLGKSLAPIAAEMTLWGIDHMSGTFYGWDNERDRFMGVEESDEYLKRIDQNPGEFRAYLLHELHVDE